MGVSLKIPLVIGKVLEVRPCRIFVFKTSLDDDEY